VLLPEEQQLERVVALVRDVLGTDAVGAYLFGSAVLGGLRPDSDLDVLAISRRPTTLEEKERLAAGLLGFSGRRTRGGRWRKVELTVVVESEVAPWRPGSRFDFQYGEWLRPEFESGDPAPWPTVANPDLAALVTMARLCDTPLFGPAPAGLLDPVPHPALVRSTVAGIESLLADLDGDTRNVLLTLARIWSTAATGAIRSKDAAADWALERLPEHHRAVLLRARAIYLGRAEERWEDLESEVRALADHVVAEIRKLAP
jgi:streptomycin 3"-adenylyltransferase